MTRAETHADRPETLRMAREFDRRSRAYRDAGLCVRCAPQAAYTHALDANRVHAPCAGCQPIVDTFPGRLLAQGWRQMHSRRPLPADPVTFSAPPGVTGSTLPHNVTEVAA